MDVTLYFVEDADGSLDRGEDSMQKTEWYHYRWLVECDDERFNYRSRERARAAAARLNSHPANVNIRAYGPYRNVDGRARVIDLGQPNPYRDGPAYAFDVEE